MTRGSSIQRWDLDWSPTSPFTSTLGTIIALFAFTYLFSSIRGAIQVRTKKDGSSPPTLPYAIPLIGHLPEFLSNTQKFLAKATARYGRDVPVRFRLLNRTMCLLKGPANVTTLLKNSRDLSSEKWLVQILVNAFGVEVADTPFYFADDTGIGHQPEPQSSDISPEHRIFYLVYRAMHNGLSGARLDEIQRQFIRHASATIVDAPISSDDWTEIPDLYGPFIRSLCFRASTIALLGSHIFEVVPTFEEDFWEFDSHMAELFMEKPSWVVPAAFKARDKMKHNVAKWQAFAREHYDLSVATEDPREWEEYFGSRLLRTRQAIFQKMPLSKSTIAADDLGFIWGASANATPAIAWMILEVVRRPELLARVRKEIAPFASWNQTEFAVDIEGLCSQSLVQSIYAEVLRVHNGTVINRVPRVPDMTVGGWKLRKDEPIVVSTYHTARDKVVWNEGTADERHPVDQFWPERFVVDPEDPNSGPVKGMAHQTGPKASKRPSKSVGPYFTMDGTEGSWVPYGGGSRMCPGRHFAKREMIVTMAMFITAFDIELSKPDEPIEHDMSYFLFGVMQPKGALSARIRRRRVA